MSTRFFTILLPGCSNKLTIPNAFVENTINQKEKRTPTAATLVNLKGEAWHVDVQADDQHGMHFGGRSWVQVLRANDLKLGYFLVFSYKGDMVFNFRAFDLSACEVSYLPVTATPTPNSTCDCKQKSSRKPRTVDIVSDDEEIDHNSTAQQFEVAMSGYNLTNQNLYIPIKFVREQKGLLLRRKQLILEDGRGRTWPVRLRHRRKESMYGSNMFFGDGWLQFAKGNRLTVGDRCIFKVVSARKKVVIQVEIIRNRV